MAAFCLLNYSNNNPGGDKGQRWEHQLHAPLLMGLNESASGPSLPSVCSCSGKSLHSDKKH